MAKLPKSPLAPKRFPKLPDVAGVRLATISAGIRYRARADLTLFALGKGTAVAGVFTKNKMPGAPVDWCRKQLRGGRARGILVKAGNANVFTGRAGAAAVAEAAAATGKLLRCPAGEIFVASTGVIGEFLPNEKVIAALPALGKKLKPSDWKRAAQAICTTDTFAKGATRQVEIGGRKVTINGIAKGSGMIAPDMATMLAFVFTDANIPQAPLQRMLKSATDRSFNCITVDSDTSTSDTILLSATGAAKNAPPDLHNVADFRAFRAALTDCLQDLAHQVVRDGEGAQKFITITVSGAKSTKSARQIGLAIANSPLVKTAIAGEDANWGRIVMAVGKSGEPADRDRLKIAIGGVAIAEDGSPLADYDEAELAPHMRGRQIDIAVDVGVGRSRATVWTCDLTHGYIDINADYRS